MQYAKLVTYASLVSLAAATTPSGFSPTVEETLSVTFNGPLPVSPPGVFLSIAGVASVPTIALSNANTSSTYMVLMVDLDIPPALYGGYTTLLHYWQPNMVASMNGTLAVEASQNGLVGAAYYPPSPPAGSGAHRYVLLAFEQPANFTLPSSYANINPPTGDQMSRVGFNITKFMNASSLNSPLAGNYFRAENTTATNTSTTTASGTMATSTASMTGLTTNSAASVERMLTLEFIAVLASLFWFSCTVA